MVTRVPITASVRTGTWLLRLAQGVDDRVVEGVGALGGAGDVIDFGALPLRHFGRQFLDHGARVACQALSDGCGCDAPTFDDHRRLNVSVTGRAPAEVRSIL